MKNLILLCICTLFAMAGCAAGNLTINNEPPIRVDTFVMSESGDCYVKDGRAHLLTGTYRATFEQSIFPKSQGSIDWYPFQRRIK